MKEISQKPYLIRAVTSWIVDSSGIPYLHIDTVNLERLEGVIPARFINEPFLTLNISKDSVINLNIGFNTITFGCTFDDRPFSCIIPMDSVLGVVDKESGHGMMFKEPDSDVQPVEMDQQSEDTTKNIIDKIQGNVISVNFGKPSSES